VAFNIPNAPSGSTTEQQAQGAPDSIDFFILQNATNGNGVISGCAVTADGTDLIITVASGTLAVVAAGVGGSTYPGQVDYAGGTTTLSAADPTNPRFDLIVVGTPGPLSHVTGTAAASPVFPTPTGLVLAAIYVAAGVTAIHSTDVIDKRMFVPSPTPGSLVFWQNYR